MGNDSVDIHSELKNENEKQPIIAKDASINIVISTDKLSAFLTLVPPIGGGNDLNKDGIIRNIRAKGIIFGIDDSVLTNISQNPIYNEQIEFAKGKAPINGENGKIDLMFDLNAHKKPTILDDGSVDFHEIGNVTSVTKGQILANIIPPKAGIGGQTVLGQFIPATNGKPAQIPRGKNTEFGSDGKTIIASIDGKLNYIDNKIHVLTVYEVNKNVDMSTGNIHFVGNVVVRGNVLTDFVIEATGNVEVHGVVEGATIKAGGDIILKRGIQGLHKGNLISGHDIIARYIEHCDVTAKNDIKCEAVMECEINCGRVLEVGGRKGLIVGGTVKAGKEIIAKTIGSQMAAVTDIQVGVDPTLRDTFKELKEKQRETEEELNKVRQAVILLSKLKSAGKITQEKNDMLIKFTKTQEVLSIENNQLEEEIDEIEQKLVQNITGKIKVKDKVFQGVKVTIGSASKFIKDNLEFVNFYLQGAEIKTLPYER